MRPKLIAIFVVFLGVFATVSAQKTSPSKAQRDFVIDPQKPFAYIEFVKTAPRKPLRGEPNTGLWLRFVNNCRLSIGITTIGSGDDLRVEHQVVYMEEVGLIEFRDGKRLTPEKRPRSEMPNGYSFDAASWHVIQPGADFQFSVPTNHVSEDWYILVPFEFMLDDSPRFLRQPSMQVSFSVGDMTDDQRTKFEEKQQVKDR